MAIVSISEAARLTGKSRKTIQRYVADGRISLSQRDAGRDGIDISELTRVFGQLSHPAPALSHVSESQLVAPDVQALETRIKVLEAELSARDALVSAQNEHLADLRQAMRLLEHQKEGAGAPGKAQKRRWWQLGRTEG